MTDQTSTTGPRTIALQQFNTELEALNALIATNRVPTNVAIKLESGEYVPGFVVSSQFVLNSEDGELYALGKGKPRLYRLFTINLVHMVPIIQGHRELLAAAIEVYSETAPTVPQPLPDDEQILLDAIFASEAA